ncbi:hypothetical protein HPP92_015641 [Vanilla planifolia]|uniref:Chlororespiratory reduction 4 n=1 Tax=Vanilla planifolia TaxID=51239 RepID=A0A835QDD4_VANPL|nr:hypothetical protein HPP92_015641 [Vanilla planifolia]
MKNPSFPNLRSLNELLTLLEKRRTLSQLLQVLGQSITTSLFANPYFTSRFIFSLTQIHKSTWLEKKLASYAEVIMLQIDCPGSFVWNTVIKFYTESSNPRKAIHLFVEMRRNGVETDEYTYPFVVTACSSMPGPQQGLSVHGEVLKRGIGVNLYVRNCLISFYCKNGEIVLARKVFDEIGAKDVISWNSIISGYAICGMMVEAQKLFDEMPERDKFSWAILIDGYGKRVGDVGRARQLFDDMPERDIVVWNSMIDIYASVGNMLVAARLFEEMPTRSVVTWSILIDGHLRLGEPKEALSLFEQMIRLGTTPDRVSVVGAISACAQLGAVAQGGWLHSYLKKSRIPMDVVIQTSLIDMYMKCGSLEMAGKLFETMQIRSIVSWNVMIVGLGTNGREAEAVELFHRMEREGAVMDDLTFLAVLTSCTHGGLINEGMSIFHRMRSVFKVELKVEHYGCFVDLLGRAGRLQEAVDVIKEMPMAPTPTMWGSLLAACRIHRLVELAEFCVEQLVCVGEDDGGVYVLMSNIYAEEGMWADVWRMRRLMWEKGMRKERGRSVVEIDGRVYEFMSGDESHRLKEEIREIVRSLALA